MKGWIGLSGATLVWLAASVAQAQTTTTRIWNVANAGSQAGDFTAQATIGIAKTVDGEPGKEVTFNGAWSRFGQNFTSPLNWANYNAYSFAVKNEGTVIAEMGIRWFKDAALTDFIHHSFRVQPGETLRIAVDTTNWTSQNQLTRMRLPIMDRYYKHVFASRPTQLSAMYQWQMYHRGTGTTKLIVSSLNGHVQPASYNSMVDEYGQLTNRTWLSKVIDINSLSNNLVNETEFLEQNPGNGETLGSSSIATQTATGRWRLQRSPKGFWYFVSPVGKVFWSLGVTHAAPSVATVVQGREQMFRNLPSQTGPKAACYGTASVNNQNLKTFDFYKSNLMDKFGSNWFNLWKDTTHKRMRSWGFNTLGNGANDALYQGDPIPFTNAVSTNEFPVRIVGPYMNGRSLPDPYASNFRTWFEGRWAGHLQWYSANPNFMGVYVDGELPWGLRGGTTREKYQVPIAALAKNNTQPAKIGYVQMLMSKYRDVPTLNAAYGTTFTAWSQVSNTPIVLTDIQLARPGVVEDLSKFLFNYTSLYYAAVKAALRNVQCKAMYLGSRDLLWTTPDEVLRGMERSVEVATFTYYEQANTIPWSVFNKLTRPVMIAEFGFMGRDENASVGFINEGAVAKDQTERSQKTLAYLQSALSKKNCVGIHWFNYVDQPVSGRVDGENYAFGLLDITDRPHQQLVSTFRNFSNSLYNTRGF